MQTYVSLFCGYRISRLGPLGGFLRTRESSLMEDVYNPVRISGTPQFRPYLSQPGVNALAGLKQSVKESFESENRHRGNRHQSEKSRIGLIGAFPAEGGQTPC